VSIHKWLIKHCIHSRLPCGNTTLIIYIYIIFAIGNVVTEQGVTAQICLVTVHFVWIPEWLIRINLAASLMRAADLIIFRGGVCFDCAWDAWGSRYLAVWDGIVGRWRRNWWSECGAALMSDGGDCGGEEIWSETGLWRKLERENGRVCKN
jgi:hypothetical protein